MATYIARDLAPKILEAQKFYPVTLITGARQVGKSTLCKHLFPDYRFVNLENISSRALAEADPEAFLNSLGETVIIDEVQNCPSLFSSIQARVDADKSSRFILTGSCHFGLRHHASQSMAGRVAVFNLPPLCFNEMREAVNYVDPSTDQLMYNGSYPGVICDGIDPLTFYRNYYSTYIERDVRNLLQVGNLMKFDAFMRLLAGRCGSEMNASSIATEVGVTSKTIAEWISILVKSYIIFPLRPYSANISKRLTKMPKYYFYDTGLLCYLLGIEEASQLGTYPLRGAIFENMAVSELLKRRLNEARDSNLSFYREYSGREVDVLQTFPGEVRAFEIKSAQTFRPDLLKNLEYLREKVFKDTHLTTTLIYDGTSVPPNVLNIRDI